MSGRETCKTCRYWGKGSMEEAGICRAHPPVSLTGTTNWPLAMGSTDWCGEHKPIITAEEPIETADERLATLRGRATARRQYLQTPSSLDK